MAEPDDSTPTTDLRKILGVIGAAVVLQLALVSAFCGVLTHPALHGAVVEVVGTPSQPPPVAGVTYRPAATVGQARSDVEHLHASAAVEFHGGRATIYTASADSATLSTTLTKSLGVALAHRSTPAQVKDLVPLPAHDRNGVGSYFLVIGWNIGAYLGAVLLVRVTGGLSGGVRRAARLVGILAFYAVVSAAAAAIVIDPVLGILTGAPWALFGVGALVVFAISLYAAGLISVLGTAGVVVAVGTLVVLGSPTSGGSVSPQMIDGPWHFLAEVLPDQHAVDLVRRAVYFHGTGSGASSLVLAIYAAAGMLVVIAQAARQRSPHELTERDLETVEGAELAALAAGE